jgi:hypothetical protein
VPGFSGHFLFLVFRRNEKMKTLIKYLVVANVFLFASCFKNSAHLVSYEVDGTSNSYEVSYLDDHGDSVHLDAITNFWRVEFTSDGDGTAKLWMRNRNNMGTAIGSIYCDDKLAEQMMVSGKDSFQIEVKY